MLRKDLSGNANERPFPMDAEAACAYAEKHELHALLVIKNGHVVFERYGAGYHREAPHPLYSGTKSFWGIAALEAQRDGILALDDIVVDTVSVRMLLQMTAGYGFGGLGNAVPTYEKALATPLKTTPGDAFTYGGIPLQVFGGFLAERLRAAKITPHEYLSKRLLNPANAEISSWRRLSDGNHPLPTGVTMTAPHWANYGAFVLAHKERYSEAFAGSRANPRYGLCWWLGATGVPQELFYASGSAGQGLYVVPSERLVAVHFGKSSSYKHDAFLKRLLST
ncbi:MAG: beta-lactamase family protein [Candidatus Eremiobacteraeota bacterium]|nr:beta-lactamase family protein [Candidatus Eremiobacteraeota bacterium]